MKEILQMYIDNGVDFTMETEPSNTITNNDAQSLANTSNNLSELRASVEKFTGCELKNYAKNTVFADGNPQSKIMLIGEAPGANEDLQGIPFCGASGKLLDKMLAAINLDRSNIYITNTIFWRPPGNRQPTPQETETCRPFTEKHIALVSPKIIVLVGGVAASTMLNSNTGISKLRNKFYQYTNQYLTQPITATAIFHPAYLLRQPKQKGLAWEDLKAIRDFLNGNSKEDSNV